MSIAVATILVHGFVWAVAIFTCAWIITTIIKAD